MVDVDSYIRRNEPTWARLDDLTRRAERGVGRLPAAELDELVRLYQRVSTHLSYARTFYRDPALTATLTPPASSRAGARRVRHARQDAADRGPLLRPDLPRVHVAGAALRPGQCRRWCSCRRVAVGVWLANSPAAVDATGPAAVREAYLQHDFEDYYSSAPAAEFLTKVFVNNIRVSILAFAVGIVLCVGDGFVLAFNGVNIGITGGLFACPSDGRASSSG